MSLRKAATSLTVSDDTGSSPASQATAHDRSARLRSSSTLGPVRHHTVAAAERRPLRAQTVYRRGDLDSMVVGGRDEEESMINVLPRHHGTTTAASPRAIVLPPVMAEGRTNVDGGPEIIVGLVLDGEWIKNLEVNEIRSAHMNLGM